MIFEEVIEDVEDIADMIPRGEEDRLEEENEMGFPVGNPFQYLDEIPDNVIENVIEVEDTDDEADRSKS